MRETTAAPPRLLTRASKDAPAPPSARDLRKARARRMVRAVGVCVGIPTLVAALYFGLLASDQYESVCTFTVQSSDGRSQGGLETLLGAIPGGSADRDVMLVREFVLSRDMLDQLSTEQNFLDHFGDSRVDWWSRLAGDADSEDRFEYYLNQLDLTHNTQSGALTLKLRAFSAERARQFAEAILLASEAMVNQLSKRAREDGIQYAQRELEQAQSRLTKARSELLAMQAEGGQLNPLMSAEQLSQVRAGLEGKLAEARTELRTLRAMMHSGAPEVREAQSRVAALERELARQNARLVGREEPGLNRSIARFEPLTLEKQFAEQAVQSALASLELARVEASRQHRYLVTIASPSTPTDATHPKRVLCVATVFLVSLLLLGIGALFVGAVREHGKF